MNCPDYQPDPGRCLRFGLPLRGEDTCRQCQADPAVRDQLRRAGLALAGQPATATPPRPLDPCQFRGGAAEPHPQRGQRHTCHKLAKPVTACQCHKCPEMLGLSTTPPVAPILAITAVYRAITKTIEHCESVLAHLPAESVFAVWDDNSPWPDCGRLFQYCVHRGIRYFRAESFGREGQGNYGFGLDWIIRTLGSAAGSMPGSAPGESPGVNYVLITESDCILPADWHARYAALVRLAPDNWGIIAGLSVDAEGRLEQPDLNRCERLKLTPRPGLNEVDNCCFAGALFNPKALASGVRFNPEWGLLPNTVGIGRHMIRAGWKCYLSPDVPIYHTPKTSRTILRSEGKRHK